MITKTVYSYDPQSRVYLRAITLDEGDLSPADLALGRTVWLVPGNCLQEAPPEFDPAKKFAVEKDGVWIVRDIPPVVKPEVPPETPVEAPEPTLEQKVKALELMVEANLNAQARAFRYTSIETAVTYAEERSVPKFWAEGRMFRKLRSMTYAKCYELLAQFLGGEIEEPTAETLPAMLPIPDTVTCAREQAELEAEIAAAEVAAAAATAAPVPADTAGEPPAGEAVPEV